MIRTIDAIIESDGSIKLLENVNLEKPHKALVTILEATELFDELRPYGLAAGQFVVPDDFDAPLPEEVLADTKPVHLLITPTTQHLES